jgi:hypothetical protein
MTINLTYNQYSLLSNISPCYKKLFCIDATNPNAQVGFSIDATVAATLVKKDLELIDTFRTSSEQSEGLYQSVCKIQDRALSDAYRNLRQAYGELRYRWYK